MTGWGQGTHTGPYRPFRGSWAGSTAFAELPDYIEETVVRGGFPRWDLYDCLVDIGQQIPNQYPFPNMIIPQKMILQQYLVISQMMIP